MSITMVSTDSAQDVTKALGMYKPNPETKTSAPAVEAQAAESVGETQEASESSLESTEASSSDAADVDQTQDADSQAIEKAAGKDKKGGFQRRIDKLTKARTLAEQERDQLREENLRLKQSQNKPPVSAQEQVSAQGATDLEPNPEQFETVRDYLKAQTRWEIKQEQKKSDLAKKNSDAKSAFQNKAEEFDKKVREFKKVTADYNDVATEFDEAYPAGMPHSIIDIISESDHGPQIMYDLAKDHEEFERVSKLSTIALAKEIGRREAKITTNPGANQSTKNKTTGAPAPMTPVRGSSAVSTKDPGDMTMREYNAWRDAGGGR